MIQVIKKAATKHGYLFITAAWLYTFSFIFTNYFSNSSSADRVSKLLEKYIANEEQEFKKISNDSSTVTAIIKEGPSYVKKRLVSDKLEIFAYQINDIGNPVQIYWNSNLMKISEEDLKRPEGSYAVTYSKSSFEFLKKTINRNGIKYFICALIPIRLDYFIHNEYLQPNFVAYPDISKTYYITNNPDDTPVKNSQGNILFRIREKPHISSDRPGVFSITFRVAAIILLMIFLNTIAIEIAAAKGFLKGFLFLTVILFVLRLLTYYFPVPFNFRNFELFSPSYYASSSLHRSLGDLLVNSILFYWLIIFIRLNYKSLQDYAIKIPPKIVRVLSFLSLFVFPFITLQLANIITSLVTDSKISLEATNFFSLSLFTFIIFIIAAFLVLSFFYLSTMLAALSSKSGLPLFWRIFMLAAISLFWAVSGIVDLPQYVCLLICGWLIVYLLIVEYKKSYSLLPFVSSPYFILWAVFLMVSVTALISYENTELEAKTRVRIAEKLELQTDPAGETWLNMAITNFTSEFLQNNFYRFYNYSANKNIKDSLIIQNFSGYLNKYDTRIYIFDSVNRPLFNEDPAPYNDIKSIIENGGKATGIPDLYYYENTSERFSYLYEKKVVSSYSSFLGSVIIVLNPKMYKDAALIPELFKQVSDVPGDMNTNYAYAIYNKRHLIKNFNDYSFSDYVSAKQLPKSTYKFVTKNDYSELWYNAGNNKTIVVAHKNNRFTYFITLFAYLFFIFILTAAILHFGNLIFKTGFNRSRLKQIFHFNIRTQIQATIITVSIFSFFVIGVATISFFYMRFDKNNRNNLNNTAQIVVSEIEEQAKSKLVFNNQRNIADVGVNGNMERKIIEIATTHNTDINLFSNAGDLLVSSQPYIYNQQVLSHKMHPKAFYALNYDRSIQEIQEEQIGKFKYKSIYMPVKDEKNNTIAYVNIPYLNSQNELNQEISDFLVTLIVLNALIFILAGAVAILLTSRITESFAFIGNKMKDINLGKTNQQIEWTRRDEIGVLVNEYNKMLRKLEQSAQALARHEREEAWREMARQVAHEIKNPLTPMK
ncbi:MAG: hypothetical protein ABJA79_01400, partial [Parafilimonas sp.]